MNKAEIIAKRGQEAYDKMLEWNRDWYKANLERQHERSANWRLDNPEKVEEWHHEQTRKGGKLYLKTLEYNTTGLRGERSKVRGKHGKMWRPYKKIIAPDSVIHHEWVPGTAKYKGMALVEKDQHMHGIIDVIKVLDGEIKVFTEEEIKEQEEDTE